MALLAPFGIVGEAGDGAVGCGRLLGGMLLVRIEVLCVRWPMQWRESNGKIFGDIWKAWQRKGSFHSAMAGWQYKITSLDNLAKRALPNFEPIYSTLLNVLKHFKPSTPASLPLTWFLSLPLHVP